MMDRDQKFWCLIWAIILTGASLFAFVIVMGTVKYNRAFIEKGYEQVSALGHSQYLWQKHDKELTIRLEEVN